MKAATAMILTHTAAESTTSLQGAQIGYNPQKPSRPRHVYHNDFKQHHTAKVKDLVIRMMRQKTAWRDCGDC